MEWLIIKILKIAMVIKSFLISGYNIKEIERINI
ncbi:Uncharacterised protein [Clostridium putrefaciens]|uniref:Uncharacterized protein n=1 Tax=Clostridium putrefaciens TaxID=99675 RepID=A0A381JAJ9_9CLOT|nr:Uncharacterised protein [Clostridium putrefaciens]SUY72790.1 Uncharacterised protein [Clostridium putrefaciens]